MAKPAAQREIKQERAARTRVEILQAAVELFARRGMLATTMAELARAIRMTPGALYWHFPTKEDLLLAAIEEVHRRFMGEFVDVMTEGRKWPARKQLSTFIERTRNFLRYHREHGSFFGVLMAESADTNERVAQQFRDVLVQYSTALTSIVKYGQKQGEFRSDVDAELFAHGMLAANMGMVVYQRLFQSTVQFDTLVDSINVPLMDGLAPTTTSR
jgi:AcrR family transcriptional regulator